MSTAFSIMILGKKGLLDADHLAVSAVSILVGAQEIDSAAHFISGLVETIPLIFTQGRAMVQLSDKLSAQIVYFQADR